MSVGFPETVKIIIERVLVRSLFIFSNIDSEDSFEPFSGLLYVCETISYFLVPGFNYLYAYELVS